eukprot:CAMPEP_0202695064 /NCGR_PEP_ID=MMETSP1385-20130828/8748_1 /ASSEMBLY_ACC=CAM_ASM_000861 /TAXON_ID=933848 /ORGANISM="Elphidium margaritaceum" /LENGTH=501 /DNA_ID=CAMNT_0049351025 /DNA_START=40 /DNA_END=1545 /DNA_ORIENTATION=+
MALSKIEHDELKQDALDAAKVMQYIEASWKKDVEKTLSAYIEVPNQSPDYDPAIHTNGYQETAYKLLTQWVEAQNVKGLTMQVLAEQNRTPLIFIEVEPSSKDMTDTVLMYGHFDKQPPLTEDWDKDLHPHRAIIKNGKLYGRGGADDGYAIFAAVNSIKVLQSLNRPYPRCCIVIEGSEESGSPDLMYYIDKLKAKIGVPRVVICLDSGCQNYEQLWMTVSLRGVFIAELKTQLLSEAVHSGDSGLVRDSFHVMRLILDRIDNAWTGESLKELTVQIPPSHVQYAKDCAECIGEAVYTQLPFCNDECVPQIPECKQSKEKLYELVLNRTWRPQVTVTGVDGMPGLKGGNVLRKYTTLKLSVRIPPSMDPQVAQTAFKKACEATPTPFGAKVECRIPGHSGAGFVNPEFEPWLLASLQRASKTYFSGKPAQFTGEGGSIPFMGQLRRKFPNSQFVITGILGPNSNAHGPNEFLEIEFTKRVMCCVASVLYDIGQQGLKSKK